MGLTGMATLIAVFPLEVDKSAPTPERGRLDKGFAQIPIRTFTVHQQTHAKEARPLRPPSRPIEIVPFEIPENSDSTEPRTLGKVLSQIMIIPVKIEDEGTPAVASRRNRPVVGIVTPQINDQGGLFPVRIRPRTADRDAAHRCHEGDRVHLSLPRPDPSEDSHRFFEGLRKEKGGLQDLPAIDPFQYSQGLLYFPCLWEPFRFFLPDRL